MFRLFYNKLTVEFHFFSFKQNFIKRLFNRTPANYMKCLFSNLCTQIECHAIHLGLKLFDAQALQCFYVNICT